MSRLRALAAASLVALVLGSGAIARASEDLPSWARDAMSAPTPAGDADAVVLLRAGSVELTGHDVFVERQRRVVRILTRDGSG
ncbi:MAG TPA: hypothetical protein VFU59_09395, partial [Candidatus Eisenbacteria bacterium]|nr:hypothetical protein [Candidatus Eisenbacteria bacterium]